MDGIEYSLIVHYGSTNSRRVAKSIFAADLFAVTQGFHVASII